MTNLLKLTLFFLVLPCVAWGQTVKADILSTSKVTLDESADEVRFMPEKLVSVKEEVVDGKTEYKTYIEPKIEFDKWNKENTLSLSIPSVEGYTDKTVDEKTGEVVMRNKTEGFYFRKPTDSNDIVKFGLILYEIPDKSKIVSIDGVEYYQWQFKLGGWEEFDFFYQPPLANVNSDGSTWEDNVMGHCERPADMSGGWVVYHKWKANHEIGKINYATGKMGNIAKPRLLDAGNNFLGWVDIEIKNGEYIVRAKSELFDAKYPLRFNDTFGLSSVGASAQSGNDCFFAAKFTASGGGQITKVYAGCHNPVDQTKHIRVALYTDSSGSCGTLIANTDSGAMTDTRADEFTSDLDTWTSTEIADGFTLVDATTYWIAWNNESGSEHHQYDSVVNGLSVYRGGTEGLYANFPPSLTGQGETNARFSICYEYTASGGTPARRRIIIISKHETNHTAGNTDTGYTDLAVCPARRKAEAFA